MQTRAKIDLWMTCNFIYFHFIYYGCGKFQFDSSILMQFFECTWILCKISLMAKPNVKSCRHTFEFTEKKTFTASIVFFMWNFEQISRVAKTISIFSKIDILLWKRFRTTFRKKFLGLRFSQLWSWFFISKSTVESIWIDFSLCIYYRKKKLIRSHFVFQRNLLEGVSNVLRFTYLQINTYKI